eukprot:m.139209 g.139209  ORF g.139209 m.139209 type:complete len:380 (+) comp14012_c0_seq1:2023-3162(+)
MAWCGSGPRRRWGSTLPRAKGWPRRSIALGGWGRPLRWRGLSSGTLSSSSSRRSGSTTARLGAEAGLAPPRTLYTLSCPCSNVCPWLLVMSTTTSPLHCECYPCSIEKRHARIDVDLFVQRVRSGSTARRSVPKGCWTMETDINTQWGTLCGHRPWGSTHACVGLKHSARRRPGRKAMHRIKWLASSEPLTFRRRLRTRKGASARRHNPAHPEQCRRCSTAAAAAATGGRAARGRCTPPPPPLPAGSGSHTAPRRSTGRGLVSGESTSRRAPAVHTLGAQAAAGSLVGRTARGQGGRTPAEVQRAAAGGRAPPRRGSAAAALRVHWLRTPPAADRKPPRSPQAGRAGRTRCTAAAAPTAAAPRPPPCSAGSVTAPRALS